MSVAQISAEVRAAAQRWTAPNVPFGTIVKYFTDGDRSAKCDTAIVQSVDDDGMRSRDLMVYEPQFARWIIRPDVRNIEDPMLPLNMHLRQNGAWDFTDEYKFMRELDKRLTHVENLCREANLESPIATKKKAS